MRLRLHGSVLGCCFAGMLLAIISVSAAEHPTSRASFQKLFDDLASTDVGVRETARLSLMRLRREDLPALRTLVQKARPLRPAQAAVLREIVQEIFLASETYERDAKTGFLGVIMDP